MSISVTAVDRSAMQHVVPLRRWPAADGSL